MAETMANVPPLLSIVTPSFNQARFLEQTMRSVLDQDYPALEYLVLDGGSTDGSLGLIHKYAARLTYWRSAPDGGQAAAIREGLSRAKGEIMGYLNSDDILLPGSLRAIADYFCSHPEVEVVSAGAYNIDEYGQAFTPSSEHGCYSLGVAATHRQLLYYGQDGVFQPATFWRRHAYEKCGGVNCRWQYIMDYDLFLRLSYRRRFGRLPRLVACMRRHAESKTSKIREVHDVELAQLRQSMGLRASPSLRERLVQKCYRCLSLGEKCRLVVLAKVGRIDLTDQPPRA